MNLKTLEVCSLVPAGKFSSERWKSCTHTHTNYEYIHGRHNRYCSDCRIDLESTENIGTRKQATDAQKIKYTNLKLKENFNIKRKDTFICWNCYNPYRNKASNALTNSKYCKQCRQEVKNLQRANKHYDSIAVSDLGLLGFIENTKRANQIANGAVFTQGFNQDDTMYSGLGRYTNSKPVKNSTYRELQQITKAYNDINKYGGEYLKQPSKTRKFNITDEEYIDEVLGFFEEEIFNMFNNTEDNDEYYYD